MRRKIYEIIQNKEDESVAGIVYDIVMICVVIFSLVPLATKDSATGILYIIDKIAVVVFIVDYLVRLCTADFKLNKGALSFALYPFTPMAIFDLLSILPSLNVLGSGFKILRVFRLPRSFRVFRVFKMIRYSKSIDIIVKVVKEQSAPLIAVCVLAIGYILTAALVIFNVEPDTFDTFFDALYWSSISLTTIGFGDICPVTRAGQVVTMLSSFVGIAVIALPSGIITGGYMDEIKKLDTNAGKEDS